jgi:hypothetical protein
VLDFEDQEKATEVEEGECLKDMIFRLYTLMNNMKGIKIFYNLPFLAACFS